MCRGAGGLPTPRVADWVLFAVLGVVLVWDYVRVEEVASADLDCVESSFADEAADGLNVELPTGGVFGYCCGVIFSVHKLYYITSRVFLQSVSRRYVAGDDDVGERFWI